MYVTILYLWFAVVINLVPVSVTLVRKNCNVKIMLCNCKANVGNCEICIIYSLVSFYLPESYENT